MPVKRSITEPDGVYFITITCHQWLSLIEMTNGYDLVYNWFDHLKGKRHCINGYVIMPNHLHALIAFRNTGQSINTIVGNGKRFMAYEIINRLGQQNETELLHQLNLCVEAKDRERNKKHEVWEDSFNWKECRTNKFMKQKLDYMHDNPCRGKWNLVTDVTKYVHSSAKFYLCGEQGIYPVMSYLELADIDLTKPVRIDAESTPPHNPSQ
jgi:REP element-mobilizing transposase RayT